MVGITARLAWWRNPTRPRTGTEATRTAKREKRYPGIQWANISFFDLVVGIRERNPRPLRVPHEETLRLELHLVRQSRVLHERREQ